jgi:hypothetical protein
MTSKATRVLEGTWTTDVSPIFVGAIFHVITFSDVGRRDTDRFVIQAKLSLAFRTIYFIVVVWRPGDKVRAGF